MSSKRFLLVHKPSGPTSHDIIDKLRKITGIRKIGHAGTLDPFASGLLLVAIGRESTREIFRFVKLDKEYVATLKLGATSDTYDRTGKIKESSIGHQVLKKEIERILQRFIGKQNQTPPMFSAKKVKGKKLYELARKGIEIERKPQKIEIYDIKLLSDKSSRDPSSQAPQDRLKIKINCTSGTYIRTLAHDIGQALGCGAYLQELIRTKIGKYKLEDAIDLSNLY